MNYRHAYHAGNIADVWKHAILAFVLDYLKRKPAPFRVIDTHAGIGLYDLDADEATRTGEFVEGIARLWRAPLPPEAEAFLAPYFSIVAAMNPDGRPRFYPGSPEIARGLARDVDRLAFCELHPEDARALAIRFRRDDRVKVVDIDGWLAAKAFVPPPERRGLLLVDPPFEERGDYGRLVETLAAAHGKWATGVFLLWYPVKDTAESRRFHQSIAALGLPKVLTVETIWRPIDGERLSGSGVVTVNAPFTLKAAVEAAAPGIWAALGKRDGRTTVW